METFTRFEKIIERLVERPFGRLFRARLHPADISQALAQALDRDLIRDAQGRRIAPNYYQVRLNPQDFEKMANRNAMTTEVAVMHRHLQDLISEAGYQTDGKLQIHISSESIVGTGQVQVSTRHQAEDSETSPLPTVGLPTKDQTRPIPKQRISKIDHHHQS